MDLLSRYLVQDWNSSEVRPNPITVPSPDKIYAFALLQSFLKIDYIFANRSTHWWWFINDTKAT